MGYNHPYSVVIEVDADIGRGSTYNVPFWNNWVEANCCSENGVFDLKLYVAALKRYNLKRIANKVLFRSEKEYVAFLLQWG